MLFGVALLSLVLTASAEPGDPARGEVIAGLGACAACHTAKGGVEYAGGYAIETRFGTFFGPNITPDPDHGIGGWSEADFVQAMREGRSPDDKRSYYPAFPYPAYTRLSDGDLADLYAHLQTIPPSSSSSREHELKALYRRRWVLGPWRMLGFRAGAWAADPDLSPQMNRGAYLVEAPGHCGECHTQRSGLGVPKRRRTLAGATDPPEPAPNITPHEDALGHWTASDWTTFFEMGMTPEGDFVGGVMRDVIREGTALLSDEDREAMAVWLSSIPPRRSRGRAAGEAAKPDDGDEW